MRVGRLLKWAGFLLAVPTVGAAAILHSIDLNDYRGEITAEFRALTGRDLAIGGDIGLSLWSGPAIVLEDVAVAGPGWGSRPAMARFGRAEARIAPIPLIVGEIRLLAGAGRLGTQALDRAVGGAGAVLGTLFSGRKHWTVVNCAASSLIVAGGRATSRATLIDTEYSTVATRGHVDLARERLRLTVEPRAKSATLNVAVPVHIGGTLARPEVRPDTGATLRKLGGLIGIALFPPAAIVGLGELGGNGNACLKIAAAPRGERARPGDRAQPALPVSPDKALGELRKGAEGVVEGLRGLGEILGGGRN